MRKSVKSIHDARVYQDIPAKVRELLPSSFPATRVLVHCTDGWNRSGCMTYGIMILCFDVDHDDAEKYWGGAKHALEAGVNTAQRDTVPLEVLYWGHSRELGGSCSLLCGHLH